MLKELREDFGLGEGNGAGPGFGVVIRRKTVVLVVLAHSAEGAEIGLAIAEKVVRVAVATLVLNPSDHDVLDCHFDVRTPGFAGLGRVADGYREVDGESGVFVVRILERVDNQVPVGTVHNGIGPGLFGVHTNNLLLKSSIHFRKWAMLAHTSSTFTL